MNPPLTIDAFLADYNAMRERAERAEAERDVALEQLTKRAPEVIQAERDRAILCVYQLVRQLERIQGYSTHAEQTELRHARAVLVEAGL